MTEPRGSENPAHLSSPPPCVLIAPDKFKGTLTAPEVAAHVARGLAASVPGVVTDEVPVADGGDGTVDAAVAAGYRRAEMTVCGPAGEPVSAALAISGDVAVIESAQACGLSRLPGGHPLPLTATSHGVGELIAAAADMGARQIVLGLGGVATTDGGAGLVRALGGRLLDADGRDIAPGGAALTGLRTLDLTGLRDLSGVDVLLASDVDNPLLGPDGAAAVYGPQKGASPADVPVLDQGLARWADVAEAVLATAGRRVQGPPGDQGRFRGRPGAGAAGGLGFAALAFLNARMRPGIEVMLDLLSFGRRVARASLVVTGEGSLDTQTLRGKAPVGVARATAAASPATPVVAVAGRCSLNAALLARAGIAAAYALTDIEPDAQSCMTNAGPLLEKLAQQIAGDWLPRRPPSVTT
jgi:glycerate 2-kinase